MSRKNSLQGRLTRMLGGGILAFGLLAAIVTFITAFSEAKDLQDHTLKQLATVIALNVQSASQNTKLSRGPGGRKSIGDPEERIDFYRIPLTAPGRLFGRRLGEGIQTLNVPGNRLRCSVHKDKEGNLIAITQPIEMRNELALNSALQVFAPMMLLLPLMTFLVTFIIRRELQPIKTLAVQIDAQAADHPCPLLEEQIVHEIKPFVQAINRLFGRMNVLITQQRRFVADASHELRSPLTALSLQVQNLENTELSVGVAERVGALKMGIERAQKLTEQLLSLARIQLGESKKKSSINVSNMARQLIVDYLPLAKAKNIDLGLDENSEIEIFGSEENIYRIIKNGLENGLKYTQPGGMVTIRLYKNTRKAYCEVVDNGPGIDENERKRLFDPFYRPTGSGQDGNGLGLAIAREAASSQGGAVLLVNNGGSPGLTFRYIQPLQVGRPHT